jgi:hypothetical protein
VETEEEEDEDEEFKPLASSPSSSAAAVATTTPSLARYETDFKNSPQSRPRRAASAPEEAAALPNGVARPAPQETSVSRSHRKRETSRDHSCC